LYAVGGNRDAARRAGIPIHRTKAIAFALAGGLAAVSGIVEVSRELGANAFIGGGTLLLEGVAACSIGGVSLFGGRGTVLSTVAGTLVIVSLSNGLDLLGVDIKLKIAITGTLVVIAVTVDAIISRGGRLLAR
jgi:D-xylose transport system permease protein